MATLDYNRDGLTDIVLTHIGEASALLKNETSDAGHCLQLELAGCLSERDAIGAKVQVQYANEVSTDFVVAGDGYLCSNESVLTFGLGESNRIDRLSIEWPSGVRQEFLDLEVDQRWLLVEGQDELFSLFPHP